MFGHYLNTAAIELFSAISTKLLIGWKFIVAALLIYIFSSYIFPYIKTIYISGSRAFVRAKADSQRRFEKEKQENIGFKWFARRLTSPIRRPIYFASRDLFHYKRIKAAIARKMQYQRYLRNKNPSEEVLRRMYPYFVLASILLSIGYLFIQE